VLPAVHPDKVGERVDQEQAPAADLCGRRREDRYLAAKHRGISWFILPMDLPGIEVRPIIAM